MAEDLDRIVKSGITWIEMSVDRDSKGLEIFARTHPQVESFFKQLSGGNSDLLAGITRSWLSDQDLQIYGYKPLPKPSPLQAVDAINAARQGVAANVVPAGYVLEYPGEAIKLVKTNQINLSWLRLVGISSPDGVKFTIPGPYSEGYVRSIGTEILSQIKVFVHDYIVPVRINLRISSTEG